MSELRPTKPLSRCDRWLARYLKRRGWVVFWLDEQARHCYRPFKEDPSNPPEPLGMRDCWLALYESERKAGR